MYTSKKRSLGHMLKLVFLGNLLIITPVIAQLKECIMQQKKVKENLFASCTEVSNKEYAYYIFSLKEANDYNMLQTSLIDSLQWKLNYSYNEPYVLYYHKHKAYENYPVVNISYNAAIAYCNWLTKLYNDDENRKYKKVQIRLPTIEEWELAAKGKYKNATYPWEDNSLQTKKGEMRANFKRGNEEIVGAKANINENTDIIAPVNSYWPNSYGLYNMAGNVAEMTSTANTIKGGSWINNAEELQITGNQTYDGSPKSYVGFRCFMEVIEK